MNEINENCELFEQGVKKKVKDFFNIFYGFSFLFFYVKYVKT